MQKLPDLWKTFEPGLGRKKGTSFWKVSPWVISSFGRIKFLLDNINGSMYEEIHLESVLGLVTSKVKRTVVFGEDGNANCHVVASVKREV